MSDNMNTPGSGPQGRRSWTENFEVAADQLTSRVQELVGQVTSAVSSSSRRDAPCSTSR